jgi:hypothetical protein
MIARIVMAILWLTLGCYMYVYYRALGNAVGGVQYLDQIGQSGAVMAITVVGVGCLATAFVLAMAPEVARGISKVMLVLTAIFVLAQWVPLPILNIGTSLRPLGFAGEYALFALPFFSLLSYGMARPSVSTSP